MRGRLLNQRRGLLVLSVCTFLFLIEARASTSLHSSIILFHGWDLNECQTRVTRAIEAGNRRLKFLFTVHYESPTPTKPSLEGLRLCYLGTENPGQCSPLSPELLSKVQTQLSKCMETATKRGIDLILTPHLDERGFRHWRNFLPFDPSKNYNGPTFADSALDTLVKAALQAYARAGRKPTFDLTLQGEMGATLFAAPTSYRKLLAKYRQLLPHSKIGLGINYDSINGGVTGFNRMEVQLLLNEVDFLAVSAYHSLSAYARPSDFDSNIYSLTDEVQRLGLVWSDSKPIRFGEVGVGGGTWPNDGVTPARSKEEVFRYPFSGFAGPKPETNPWRFNPLNEARRQFYQALITFLETARVRSRLPVPEAYIWSYSSWDAQGISHGTAMFNPADPVLFDLIKRN